MSAELLFEICNKAVLPAWILLAVAPRWIWTRRIIFAAYIPGLLAVAYIYCFYAMMPAPEGGSFSTLEGVMIFFTVPYAVVAGWIHYLAFDLFVGAWEVRDAERRGISHWFVIPCLFFTLMLGPVGLLLYFILRAVMRRTLTTEETVAAAAPA